MIVSTNAYAPQLLTTLAVEMGQWDQEAKRAAERMKQGYQLLKTNFVEVEVSIRLRASHRPIFSVRSFDRWKFFQHGSIEAIEGRFVTFRAHNVGVLQDEGYHFILQDNEFQYAVPQRYWTPVAIRTEMGTFYADGEPPWGSLHYLKYVRQLCSKVVLHQRAPASSHATAD